MPPHGALVNCGLRCKPVISSHVCSVLPWEPQQPASSYLSSSAIPAWGGSFQGRERWGLTGVPVPASSGASACKHESDPKGCGEIQFFL